MLNTSIHYRTNSLYVDDVPIEAIVRAVGTPVYVYSLRRALQNYHSLADAFASHGIHAEIHYSAKANANLTILRTLIDAGAGIDAVSGGEIYRALHAGAHPGNVVFAGVGKTVPELRYAVEQQVGWINIENREECDLINDLAGRFGKVQVVALRLNPNISAKTIPHIATGHSSAKFGLSADVIHDILSHADRYSHLAIRGIHVHIGSQLHDATETAQAVMAARSLASGFPTINTLNIGGGFPTAYHDDEALPTAAEFAKAIKPALGTYKLILEPGRSIIADAGILISEVQYVKEQGGDIVVVLDAGMTDLIRPMLYDAQHLIVPIQKSGAASVRSTVVGPVCESTDVFAQDIELEKLNRGDHLAILTTGAYGMVMSSTYNARPRPAEVVISPDGTSWSVARRRETWEDLIQHEV